MSHEINIQLAEALGAWLEERGRKPSDICDDERGKYIMDLDSDTGEYHKMYLPMSFQEL